MADTHLAQKVSFLSGRAPDRHNGWGGQIATAIRPEPQARPYSILAGIDEAGCGPLAGPVVAAAVVLKTPRLPVVIRDSKLMTPGQRELAYRHIQQQAWIGIARIEADEIDRINILQARLRAMQQACLALQDLSPPIERALVDGPQIPELDIPAVGIIDGDQKIYVISCASIIAKVTRDRIMQAYHIDYPHYDFLHNKGYPTFRHLAALKEFGPCPIHRKSFRPVQQTQRQPQNLGH